MIKKFYISTEKKNDMYDITNDVKAAVNQSGIANGICVVYCPHTTTAITINENSDPNVKHDILTGLDKTFPDSEDFLHYEGNSTAHLKASCIGTSETIIVENNKLLLGQWQAIYFCEFDGPRQRIFFVKIL